MAVVNRLLLLALILFAPIVVFGQAPVANFTATPTEGCVPLAVQFDAGPPVSGVSYNWSIPGAGTIPTTNSTPSTIFTTPGTKTITLTVSNTSGSSSKTLTVIVHDTPSVNFTASPTSGCNPLTVQFNDASASHATGSSTYSWAFGDGSPFNNSQNPSHIYTATGCKNVTLQLTNSNGCSQSKTKNNLVCINPTPEVSFTVTVPTFCRFGGTTTFNSTVANGTPPYTYDWDFDDGSTHGTTANPSHTYTGTAPRTYNVKLTVTDANGCQQATTLAAAVVIKDVTASFTGGSNACVGTSMTLTNTSTPSFTASDWDFGGDGISNLAVTNHTFYTAGTYNIRLITSDGPCKDTAYRSVTIYPQPTIDFTANPTDPCPAPVTVAFAATGNASSYAWDFHPGTATGQTQNHTYTTNDFYDVSMIGTDSHGCKDTIYKTSYVKVRDIVPIIEPDKNGGCIPATVTFTVNLYSNIPAPPPAGLWTYPFPTVSYDWDFGDNTTHSNVATPSHTYTTAGTYNVILTGVTSNGCTYKDTFEIRTGTPPTPDFYAIPLPSCIHSTITFTSTSTGTITDYLWDFGDGFSSSLGPSTTHAYDTTGVFNVTLTTINNRCPATITKTAYMTINGPWARYKTKVDCANPKKVDFTYKVKDYTSTVLYFGDGNFDNSAHVLNDVVTHTYSSLGTYNTMMVAFNSVTGCSDTFRARLKLIDPKAQMTATDTTICKGGTARFTGGLSGGETPISLAWWVDGVYYADSMMKYTHGFNNTGYYDIRLVATDSLGCRDTLNKIDWVLASKPTVDFSASPTSGCSILSSTFSDLSTLTPGTTFDSRTWIFLGNGGGLSPSPSPVTKTFAAPGTYDVKLIVTDSHGCKDSLQKDDYIEVWKPAASFNVNDMYGCIGQALEFECNTNDAATANWDFGDGNSGTGVSTTHAYAATGTYTVTMVVTDIHGCKDTIERTDYIKITKPDAKFTLSDTFSVCPPLQVVANNTSTGGPLKYDWDMGNGNKNTLINPNDVYNSGFHVVTLIVEDTAGCTDTAYSSVNVLGYAGSFTYAPLTGCAPLDVNFSANLTNVPSVVWDFSDGITVITNGVATTTHTYTIPGSYFPKIILSDGAGCTNSSDGKDTIRVDGVKVDFEYSPACEGSEVIFKDKSTAYFSAITGWLWQFHDGTTSLFDETTMYYPNTGTYKVKFIVTNGNGCKDSLIQDIVVNPLPVINAGLDTTICLGDATQLLGSGGVSYVWSPASGLSCTNCPDPLASPAAETEYSVIGTDANKCSDTDQVIIGIKTKTDSEVDTGGEICDGQIFQLRARGAQRYEWFPAINLNDSKAAEPVASPNNTTTYVVVAYEGSCIPDTHSVKIVVHPLPDVTASGAATIIAGGSTQLNSNGSLIDRFLWAPASSLSCSDCSNPMATPTRTTDYVVTVFTDHGCQDSDKVTITVLCDKSQLFIPNTFTPNGDGHNDVFYPRGVGLDQVQSFRVYNRWGEVVYQRSKFNLNDKAAGWDGTYKGQQLPPDVFVYIVEAICDNGDLIQWKGDITLVR